ncbi:MAG: hypothetical protein HN712_12325 [Gemmatimonadetes bacterium]|nr:hypothetical protein [Gemmatimonadota bacterium]MBT7861097.1 hypothetical protein [Gemmatimonadota bacterium]
MGRNPSSADALLLVLLCLLAHGRSMGGVFHYDDLHSIVDNEHIRSLALIPALFTDPTTFSGLSFGAMFRPLVMLSYALTYAVFALEPGIYLATNFILHVGVVLVCLAILRHFIADRFLLLGAAALIGVHPVNVETVAYVSTRSESMCALFMLLGLWLFWKETGPRWWYWLAVFCYACALMSKSVGITLLPMLAIHQIWFATGSLKCRGLRLLPFFAVTIAYLTIVSDLLRTSLVQAPVREMGAQLLTQSKALIYYLHLLSVPWGLSVEHQFEIGRSGDVVVWLSVLFLLSSLLLIIGAGLGQRSRWWLLWGLVVLAPTLIVPLNVLVNEHRLYMVSIGFAALLGTLIVSASLQIQRVSMVAIGLLVVLSFQRSAVWADTHILWQDAVTKGPMMPRGHLFVGDSEAASGRYGQALGHYEQALQVNPPLLSDADRLIIHNNRGAALLALGALGEARQAYLQVVGIDSTYQPARDALAGLAAFDAEGDEEKALVDRRRGLSAMVAGDIGAATHYLRQSLTVISHGGTWLVLGSCHERLGQTEEAVDIYRMLSLGSSQAAITATERLARLGASDGIQSAGR